MRVVQRKIMRFVCTLLLVAVFSMLIQVSANAGNPVILEIHVGKGQVTYSRNRQVLSLLQIEDWFRKAIAEFGQPKANNSVYIFADQDTPVLAVFKLMRALKNSGLENWYLVGQSMPVSGAMRTTVSLGPDGVITDPEITPDVLHLSAKMLQPQSVPHGSARDKGSETK